MTPTTGDIGGMNWLSLCDIAGMNWLSLCRPSSVQSGKIANSGEMGLTC
jgi:hypothetical protein